MFVMILISSTAVLVGIVGSIVIWGMDAHRAEEIEHPRDATPARPALAPVASTQEHPRLSA